MFPTLGVSINIVARQATTSSDVVNDTTAPHTLAVVGSLTGFATLIVGLRVYVRALVLRRFGTDDYIIVLALVDLISHGLPCLICKADMPIDLRNRGTCMFHWRILPWTR